MNKRPRGAAPELERELGPECEPEPEPELFSILDLLAHLLELGLGGDDELRYAQAVGLRAHRVHFAVHLLQQEVELAAARFGTVGERDPVRDVAAKARHLLADVRARRRPYDFLRDDG